MNNFEYASPTSVKEAAGLLSASWGETEILAGGTDVISLMKEYVSTPKRVVSLKGIAALSGIKKDGDTVQVGSMVTLQELLDHKEFANWFPALVQAAEGVTSPQVRAMGTVGGDLCQRPRCWYYRSGFGLLAKGPDGEPLVPRGDNRYHAIYGGGPAYFVSPSSLGPGLIALGAKVNLEGPNGKTRSLPVAEFFVAPKSSDQRENALKANEIVTGISIPASSAKSATYEVRQKMALDWPLAAASVAIKLNGKKVESATVVLGHVAPIPWHSTAAENALKGKEISEAVAEAAGKAATEGAKPLSGNAYKVRLVQTAVKRAILRAAS